MKKAAAYAAAFSFFPSCIGPDVATTGSNAEPIRIFPPETAPQLRLRRLRDGQSVRISAKAARVA